MQRSALVLKVLIPARQRLPAVYFLTAAIHNSYIFLILQSKMVALVLQVMGCLFAKIPC